MEVKKQVIVTMTGDELDHLIADIMIVLSAAGNSLSDELRAMVKGDYCKIVKVLNDAGYYSQQV